MLSPKTESRQNLIFWTIFLILGAASALISFIYPNFNRLSFDHLQAKFATLTWLESGQAPPVGPYTSYTTVHLPPLYYQVLFPFYLLTHNLDNFDQVANFVYTWTIFLFLAFLIHKKPIHRWSYLTLVALLNFHPLIMNSRLDVIWNPSFVWPTILLASYSLILIDNKKVQPGLVVLSAGASAISLGLNLLAGPIVIALGILSILKLRRRAWWWLLTFFLISGLIWLPSLITQYQWGYWGQNGASIWQSGAFTGGNLLFRRLGQILLYSFTNQIFTSVIPIVIVFYLGLIALIAARLRARRNQQSSFLREPWQEILLVLIISLVISVIPNIVMHSWYVIGIATLWCLLIATLPSRGKYILATLLLVWWGMLLSQRIKSTNHEITAFQNCLQPICDFTQGEQYAYTVLTLDSSWNHNPADLTYSLEYYLSLAGCPPVTQTTNRGLNLPRNLDPTDNQFLLLVQIGNETPAPSSRSADLIATANCQQNPAEKQNFSWALFGK